MSLFLFLFPVTVALHFTIRLMKKLYMRKERKKHGWTLGFVGKELGITKTAVHDIETGKRKPSYKVLIALENLFQLPHRYLLVQEGEEIPTFSCYCKNLDGSIVAIEKGNKQ